MARPAKIGLDYLELDCRMDDKVKLIQAEFGLKGFAVVVKLLQKIYGEKGYYCEWNNDALLLFMSDNGLSGDSKNLIDEIVAACIRRNIFSEELYKKYGILTSSGVQKRYLNATSKREVVNLKKEYLLLSVGKNSNNVVINSVSDGGNSINVVGNTQSREEKSREEKNIVVSNDTTRQTHSVQRAVEEWNLLADVGIKPVSKMASDSTRYKMLTARVKQYGIDDVVKAIQKIRYSDFLQGSGKKGWIITFDWFIRPNNFPKVLDGQYDNKDSQSLGEWDDL